jgi:copper chaperone CopZ
MNIRIDGRSCQQCVEAVRNALQPLEGVQVTLVAPCSALLQLSPGRHSVHEILDAIRVEGFSLSAHTSGEERVA